MQCASNVSMINARFLAVDGMVAPALVQCQYVLLGEVCVGKLLVKIGYIVGVKENGGEKLNNFC